MTQSIYHTATLTERSFFQKLFMQHPEENAVVELNNLLATKPIKQIAREDIAVIERKYNLSLEKEFKLNLEEFYAVYLNYCLIDKSLSSEEVENLRHLKNLLSLDNSAINELHTLIGEIVYKKSFEEAVADGRFTANKEKFLHRLETDLKLPKQLTEKISAEVGTAFLEKYISGIIKDQQLSPDEEQKLQAIATGLNIQMKLTEETKQQLVTLKLYWALENLELPSVQTDIALQRAELCYLKISNINWYELRSVRLRTSYSGYSTSFKVAKEFYLRSGSHTPRNYSVNQMTLIDNGNLYLTNKRIIFTGSKKNSNIRFEKILSITPYAEGVEIDKETGKTPLLQFAEKADVFCIILERLLRERTS